MNMAIVPLRRVKVKAQSPDMEGLGRDMQAPGLEVKYSWRFLMCHEPLIVASVFRAACAQRIESERIIAAFTRPETGE